MTCDTCHERLDLHGGPRRSVEYCVTCHNPGSVDPDSGNSVDMAYMVHSIHAGVDRANFATTPPTPVPYIVYGFTGANDFGDVTYPQSLLFCDKCHTKSTATPDGDAWKTSASASACGGCHITGLKTTSYNATTGYTYTYTHSTFAFTATDGTCVDCHRADGVAGSTADRHLLFYSTSSSGANSAGAPLAKSLGAQFKNEILSVTNVGLNKIPTVKFRVSNPATGKAYDIVNDKSFTSSGASLNINIAWDPATDITNAKPDGTEPGLRSNSTPRRSAYALQMNLPQIVAAAKTAGQATDGSYTIPFFTAVPVDTTNLMVQMDGHPRALPPGVTDWAKAVNAAAGMTVFYTGAKRATLVAQTKCENCHNQLSFHGANRNGDPQGCLVCHNSERRLRGRRTGHDRDGRVHPRPARQQRRGDRRDHVSAEPRELPGMPHHRHVPRGTADRDRDQHRFRYRPLQHEGRHVEHRDFRHLFGLPHERHCEGAHGAERRTVRRRGRQDLHAVVRERSLRRLPWPGPRGGHRGGPRRVSDGQPGALRGARSRPGA